MRGPEAMRSGVMGEGQLNCPVAAEAVDSGSSTGADEDHHTAICPHIAGEVHRARSAPSPKTARPTLHASPPAGPPRSPSPLENRRDELQDHEDQAADQLAA